MRVRSVDGSAHAIQCPGCGMAHCFDARWSFNGSFDRPTFSPSLLVRWVQWTGPELDVAEDRRCHIFVREGRVEFLQDSSHELAGQTVDLPEWEAA